MGQGNADRCRRYRNKKKLEQQQQQGETTCIDNININIFQNVKNDSLPTIRLSQQPSTSNAGLMLHNRNADRCRRYRNKKKLQQQGENTCIDNINIILNDSLPTIRLSQQPSTSNAENINMDEKNEKKFRELKKFIKFLQYRISHNTVQKSKFVQIVKWLQEDVSSFNWDNLNKIERSIIEQYRKCIKEKRPIPDEFHVLFQNGRTTDNTILSISDDEDETVDLVEVQSVPERTGNNKQINVNAEGRDEISTQDDDIEFVSVDLLLRPEELIYNNKERKRRNSKSSERDAQHDINPKKSKRDQENVSNAANVICIDDDDPAEEHTVSVPVASIVTSEKIDIPTIPESSNKNGSNNGVAFSSTGCQLYYRREKNISFSEDVATCKENISMPNHEKNISEVPATVEQANSSPIVIQPVVDEAPPKQIQPILKFRMNDPRIAKQIKMLQDSRIIDIFATGGEKQAFLTHIQKDVNRPTPTPSTVPEVKNVESFDRDPPGKHIQNRVNLPSPGPSKVPKVNDDDSCQDTPRTYPEHKRLKALKMQKDDSKNKNQIESDIGMANGRKDVSQQAQVERQDESTKSTSVLSTVLSILEPHKKQLEERLNRDSEPNKSSIYISKENIDLNKSSKASKMSMSKTDKAIKELECTVKGYDNLSDFFSTSNGRRPSSIIARNQIAEQLNDCDGKWRQRHKSMSRFEDEDDEEEEDSETIIQRWKSVGDINKYHESSEELNHSDNQQSRSIFKTIENVTMRQNIKKQLDLTKPCSVQLERLSQDIVDKYMNKTESENQIVDSEDELTEGMVMIPQSKEMPKNILAIPKNIPNTNINMTERDSQTCVLCKVKSKYLISHYVRTHKCESYVSRLSEEDIVHLTRSIPFAEVITTSKGKKCDTKYSVQCGICRQQIILPFDKLFEHYSKHTGEFAYECNGCGRSFPELKLVNIHTSKSKSCKEYGHRIVYLYPENLKTIYLYRCRICNFIQLNEANTYKHLRDHHYKRSDDPACIDKIIICAKDVSANNYDDMKFSNEDMDITVNNEPLCEEQYEHENTNGELDHLREPSPHTFLDELMREDGITDFELDIKPDIDAMVTLGYANEMEATTSKSDNQVYFDQHQPFTVKIESEEPLKSLRSYKAHDQSLLSFGYLQCMAVDCHYTTNDDEEMIQHLNDHSNSISPPANLLECSYCQLSDFESPEMLIMHVREKHAFTRFQCNTCHYRSCVVSNVLLHYQMFHSMPGECEVIYECIGPTVDSEARMVYMTNCWSENVKKLQCLLCFQQFYTLALMEEHYKTIHNYKDSIEGKLKPFACIYCGCEMFNRLKVQQHIALMHPDELNYACERVSDKANEEDLLMNLRVYDITVANFTGLIKSVDVELRNEEMKNQEGVNDVKLVKEEIVDKQRDKVRASLKKITEKTGVPPDRLFICPEANCCAILNDLDGFNNHITNEHDSYWYKCPHCSFINESYDKTKFAEHIKEHYLHTYVCFHCCETFVDESSIKCHFRDIHSEVPEFRFQCIQFNKKYGYFIGISVELQHDMFTFLVELHELILNRIEKLKELEANRLQSVWPVPLSSTTFEDLPNYMPKYLHACVQRGCAFRTPDSQNFYAHIQKHCLVNKFFTCTKCNLKFSFKDETQKLISHISSHLSCTINICNMCSATYALFENLLAHVKSEHNKRDVFMISIDRTTEGKLLELRATFKVGRKTFSTIKDCCGCDPKQIDHLAIHLRDKHQIYLTYFCSLCQQKLENLKSTDEHFKTKHADKELKIYASFFSFQNVEIISLKPLLINVESNSNEQQKPVTHSEDITDSDILGIYEGDDLIIAEEMTNNNKAQTEELSSKLNSIKIVTLETLTDASIATTSDVAATQSANVLANNIPRPPQYQEQQNIVVNFSTAQALPQHPILSQLLEVNEMRQQPSALPTAIVNNLTAPQYSRPSQHPTHQQTHTNCSTSSSLPPAIVNNLTAPQYSRPSQHPTHQQTHTNCSTSSSLPPAIVNNLTAPQYSRPNQHPTHQQTHTNCSTSSSLPPAIVNNLTAPQYSRPSQHPTHQQTHTNCSTSSSLPPAIVNNLTAPQYSRPNQHPTHQQTHTNCSTSSSLPPANVNNLTANQYSRPSQHPTHQQTHTNCSTSSSLPPAIVNNLTAPQYSRPSQHPAHQQTHTNCSTTSSLPPANVNNLTANQYSQTRMKYTPANYRNSFRPQMQLPPKTSYQPPIPTMTTNQRMPYIQQRLPIPMPIYQQTYRHIQPRQPVDPGQRHFVRPAMPTVTTAVRQNTVRHFPSQPRPTVLPTRNTITSRQPMPNVFNIGGVSIRRLPPSTNPLQPNTLPANRS